MSQFDWHNQKILKLWTLSSRNLHSQHRIIELVPFANLRRSWDFNVWCCWECLGTCIENLQNMLGSHWKLDVNTYWLEFGGNTLRTSKSKSVHPLVQLLENFQISYPLVLACILCQTSPSGPNSGICKMCWVEPNPILRTIHPFGQVNDTYV